MYEQIKPIRAKKNSLFNTKDPDNHNDNDNNNNNFGIGSVNLFQKNNIEIKM